MGNSDEDVSKTTERNQQYVSGRRGRTKVLEKWPVSGVYADVLGLALPLFFLSLFWFL